MNTSDQLKAASVAIAKILAGLEQSTGCHVLSVDLIDIDSTGIGHQVTSVGVVLVENLGERGWEIGR